LITNEKHEIGKQVLIDSLGALGIVIKILYAFRLRAKRL